MGLKYFVWVKYFKSIRQVAALCTFVDRNYAGRPWQGHGIEVYIVGLNSRLDVTSAFKVS